MSDLTDLVPPLELCKLIPAGEFEDSVLVWIDHRDVYPEENANPSVVVRKIAWAATSKKGAYPAPTLQEIMKKIGGIKDLWLRDPLSHNSEKTIRQDAKYQPSITYSPEAVLSWCSMRWRDSIYDEYDTTAADAAIRTYLNIKGIKVTMPCPECETWMQHLGDDQLTVECFGDIRVSVTEVCPKCGYKYYDGLFLHIYHDIEKHLIYVNTPMGSRWIKKSEKSC